MLYYLVYYLIRNEFKQVLRFDILLIARNLSGIINVDILKLFIESLVDVKLENFNVLPCNVVPSKVISP